MNGGTNLERPVPWTPMRNLLGFDPFENLRSSWGYDYDVSRTETGYAVEVPVPGYTSSQIEVAFKDGIVTVAGNSDRRTFTRSFTVPEDVDTDAIDARVENGMLTLELRRRPEAQPRKIQVK
jgi:HSP20 family protein